MRLHGRELKVRSWDGMQVKVGIPPCSGGMGTSLLDHEEIIVWRMQGATVCVHGNYVFSRENVVVLV